MITSAQVKENNGGGLQIECYDAQNDIVAVIACGHTQKTGINDLVGIVDGTWEYNDANQWYDTDGNSMGDCDDNHELTASDVVDNHDSTKTIAEYDGDTMTIYYSRMGRAGSVYFGKEIK